MLIKQGQVLPVEMRSTLSANAMLSIVGFYLATRIIQSPVLQGMFIKAGLKGIDLNKATTKRNKDGSLVRLPSGGVEGIPIPESQGVITSAVYIIVLSLFIPYAFYGYSAGGEFPYIRLCEYLAALSSVGLAAFMGFADDVLDLRWKHKIPLPFFANLPLLLVYRASGGLTGVEVPTQLRPLLGNYMELGILFYVFLLLLTIFSTHAINIYAGVNGLEVGQSVVISASIVILNLVQLNGEFRSCQMQSLQLMLPFLAVSVALMRLNWWPSKVFVGDTYAYFAGGALATASIVGHFSKTMVLLLIPQFLNFLYGMPQLFRLIECPRHRMPAFDSATGFVKNSYCEVVPAKLSSAGKLVFWVFKTFRLVDLKESSEPGSWKMSNLTLINFFLFKFGPMREDKLCFGLLMLQVLCAAFAFMIRFGAAGLVFDVVR